MARLLSALERALSGNGPWDFGVAASVAVLVFLTGMIARRLARARAQRLALTPEQELTELPLRVISQTTSLFVGIVAASSALSTLELPDRARGPISSALTLAFFVQAGIWCTTAMAVWLERKRTQTLASDRGAVGSLGIIGFVVRASVWTLVLLLALDNLGVDITALVAGLGVGGIAVALAVQNVLGDLLASLSIALDRPFVIGDFVVVGDFMGSVENIGIKSVRIRSLSGEQIVMSNADLLNSRVRNYGRMIERRVTFTIGVTYETPHASLLRIPDILSAIIKAQPDTRFDRAHFAKFGAFSLDFESVYYVLSPDYNRYMDIQQAINLAIHAELERQHIDLAYPTQRALVVLTEHASPSNGSCR